MKNRKILVCLFAVLLSPIACELAVRARSYYRFGIANPNFAVSTLVYDPDLDLRVPRPNFVSQGSKCEIRINSLGFRNAEFSREKASGTIRIVCLGASTTFGPLVSSNSNTWPHKLQDALQERFPERRFEVINAGVPGYRLELTLKNLRHRVLPLKPDLVIIYHANSDITYDTRELAVAKGLAKKTANTDQTNYLDSLARHSMFVDLLRKNLRIRHGVNLTVKERLTEIPAKLPDRFIGLLQQAHDLLEQNDVTLVLSVFLYKFRREQTPQQQAANTDLVHYYMPWLTMEALFEATDSYNEAILRLAHEQGISVVDDRHAIPGDDKHYVDFVHMTDLGCAAMAQRFLKFLVQQKIIERLPRQH